MTPFPDAMWQQTRRICPQCGEKSPFWCYRCLIGLVEGVNFPRVAIENFRFSILIPEAENRSRNTGPHAAVLAPDACELLTGVESNLETMDRCLDSQFLPFTLTHRLELASCRERDLRHLWRLPFSRFETPPGRKQPFR